MGESDREGVGDMREGREILNGEEEGGFEMDLEAEAKVASSPVEGADKANNKK